MVLEMQRYTIIPVLFTIPVALCLKMAKLKATGGLEVQLESSSEGYRELPVDVGGLEDRTLERCTGVDEETDGGRRTILNGTLFLLKIHMYIVGVCVVL